MNSKVVLLEFNHQYDFGDIAINFSSEVLQDLMGATVEYKINLREISQDGPSVERQSFCKDFNIKEGQTALVGVIPYEQYVEYSDRCEFFKASRNYPHLAEKGIVLFNDCSGGINLHFSKHFEINFINNILEAFKWKLEDSAEVKGTTIPLYICTPGPENQMLYKDCIKRIEEKLCEKSSYIPTAELKMNC